MIILYLSIACILIVICLGIYWYKHKEDPYKNPPEPIQHIKDMYKAVYPSKADIPIKEGNESYTMGKSKITMCLRDPNNNNQYYPWNTLAYVALHEMAHVITTQKEKDDHGPIFTKNFKMLLKKAEALGYFDSKQKIPDVYCGVG